MRSATDAQAEKLGQFRRPTLQQPLFSSHQRQRDSVGEKPPVGAAMAADHDVLPHRQRSEQREVLERAADAERGDAMDRVARQRAPFEGDRALVEAVEARETVEQRGLAGAIGPDQPADLAARDVEADLIEREHAAEPHGDAFDGQHLHSTIANLRSFSRENESRNASIAAELSPPR